VAVGLLGTAGSSIYAHRFLRRANALDVASIRMITAALVLVPVVLLTVGYDLGRVQTSGWVALLYGGLVGGFAAYLLSFYIVKRFGATASSLTTYVIPVVTAILGAVFLKEQLTPLVIGSMVVILIGVALLNSGPKPGARQLPGPDA
jgi:drug/metabolite transporter (DMT)-like permease